MHEYDPSRQSVYIAAPLPPHTNWQTLSQKLQEVGRMSDIAMCKNEACPLKQECYRYMAVPSYWQSYTMFDENDTDRCFWPIEDRMAKEEERGG